MKQALTNALAATALIGLSFYLLRAGSQLTDWAVLSVMPLTVFLFIAFRTLSLATWKARLAIALRSESPLARVLTGQLRAAILAMGFATTAVSLLSLQALSASGQDSVVMLFMIFASGCIFSTAHRCLSCHFHAPFARTTAISIGTWAVALPFYIFVAYTTWADTAYPGDLLDANFMDAIQLGVEKGPARDGFLSDILRVFHAFEAVKVWGVVQLRDYPLIGAVFCLDAALFSFVLARTSIVVTQFAQSLDETRGQQIRSRA